MYGYNVGDNEDKARGIYDMQQTKHGQIRVQEALLLSAV